MICRSEIDRGHDLPGPDLILRGAVQAQQGVEQPQPQRVLHDDRQSARGDPATELAAEPDHRGQDQRGHDHRQAGTAVIDAGRVVDGHFRQQRGRQIDGHRDQRRGTREHDQTPVLQALGGESPDPAGSAGPVTPWPLGGPPVGRQRTDGRERAGRVSGVGEGSVDNRPLRGRGPNAMRAFATTFLPSARLPMPPITAPAPAGRSLPMSSGARLKAYLRAILAARLWLSLPIRLAGVVFLPSRRKPAARTDDLAHREHALFAEGDGQHQRGAPSRCRATECRGPRRWPGPAARMPDEQRAFAGGGTERGEGADVGTAAVAPTALLRCITARR